MTERELITGQVPPLPIWNYEHKLVVKQEGAVEFTMVEGEVYDAPAFFNPVMVLNRDFSILFARVFAKREGRKIRFFEPLAGIGIRALRMIHEISESIEEIASNDFGEISSALGAYNRAKLDSEEIIIQYKREARSLATDFAEKHYKFHFIDIDPFGPPTPFLDSMWNALILNAYISITATDMTALCGVYPKACLRKYGSIPYNNYHTHETAARILIATVARSAARFGKGVQPLFTLSADHYLKIFFRVEHGRGEANAALAQIKYGGTCHFCQKHKFFDFPETFTCCGKVDYYGPIWTGELFNTDLCTTALAELSDMELPSKRKMEKFLMEATQAKGLPFYYALEYIASKLQVDTPSTKKLFAELETKGYRAMKTRFRKQAFRTDAPIEVVEEIVKTLG